MKRQTNTEDLIIEICLKPNVPLNIMFIMDMISESELRNLIIEKP